MTETLDCINDYYNIKYEWLFLTIDINTSKTTDDININTKYK